MKVLIDPEKLSRRNNSEKTIAKNLLDGFVMKGSKGENFIESISGTRLNQISLTALIQIAQIISELASIKFPRNYKRKKDLIVKWFNDNIDAIDEYKDFIEIDYGANDKTEIKHKKNRH